MKECIFPQILYWSYNIIRYQLKLLIINILFDVFIKIKIIKILFYKLIYSIRIIS